MNIKKNLNNRAFPYYIISKESIFKKNAIILLHGFGQSKEYFLEIGKLLFQNINQKKSFTNPTDIIIIDLNQHGDNTESLDLNNLFKNITLNLMLLNKDYKSISLLGLSLGSLVSAYIANELKNINSLCLISLPPTLNNAFPKKIKTLILGLISSFVQFKLPFFKKNTLYQELTREISFLKFRIGYKGIEMRTGDINYIPIPYILQFFNSDFSSFKYVSKIKQPVLFIYGGEDGFLNLSNNKLDNDILKLFHSCISENKYLYLVKNASHGLSVKDSSNLELMNNDLYKKVVIEEIVNFFVKFI